VKHRKQYHSRKQNHVGLQINAGPSINPQRHMNAVVECHLHHRCNLLQCGIEGCSIPVCGQALLLLEDGSLQEYVFKDASTGNLQLSN
jgi:hypothetical protein